MPLTLTVTAGPHAGRVFTFDRHDTFLVGRSAEAHFSLPDDPYFSRMHFLVEVNPPLCRLTDLNSHNGTLVNGQKLQEADLHNGDEIRGGHTILRVSAPAAATLDLPLAEAAGAARPDPLASAATLDDSGLPPALADFPPPLDASTHPQLRLTAGPGFPIVHGYRLLKEIGRGGMGVVYRGIHESDGSEVAIKTIRPGANPGPTAIARFLREAAILKELRHPRIVGFRDSGEVGGLLYFVMDFVPGRDAAQLVTTEGPLPMKRAVGIIMHLLEALTYAHAKGFVHRDIKPANLLVSGEPGQEAVRVADFGLARTYQESALSGLTLSGSAAGTPQFMPPEQVTDFRSVKPAADLYSTAATLYHLLTGKYVYDGVRASDLFRQILLENPVPLRARRPELPAGLDAVVHRALARLPADRYADAGAFARALQPFA